MKNYSRYMQERNAYILGYEVDGGKINIRYPNVRKNKPNQMETKRENIVFLNKTLEEQYKFLIKNRSTIEGTILKLTVLFGVSISIIFVALMACIPSSTILGTLSICSVAFSSLALITESIHSKKFNQKVDLYERFIKNLEEINRVVRQDSNITKYISKKAKNVLQNQNVLVMCGLIDAPIDIKFIHDVPEKDLEEILRRKAIYDDNQRRQKRLEKTENNITGQNALSTKKAKRTEGPTKIYIPKSNLNSSNDTKEEIYQSSINSSSKTKKFKPVASESTYSEEDLEFLKIAELVGASYIIGEIEEPVVPMVKRTEKHKIKLKTKKRSGNKK